MTKETCYNMGHCVPLCGVRTVKLTADKKKTTCPNCLNLLLTYPKEPTIEP